MNTFREYGKTGLFRFDTGWIYEEFLRELQGRKGIEVYKEMSENDDIIGAILFATEMLMRQSKWSIQEAGTEQADLDAAEFVRTCMDDMEETWSDFISEVLSFLTYGWSYHEIVYKRRMGRSKNPETNSKYTDGLIGWRKLPIRSQDTLWEWKYDEKDNLIGLVQCAPPLYEQVFIPIEKALHFKTKSRKGNPEGRSVLRNCYRNWYFKRRIQEIEGIGIERDLAGLPVLEAPEGVDIWSDEYAAELAKAERIVRSVRRDEREGIVLGNGWKFSLTSTGGRRQFDTNQIIERYDTRMAMTVLADFVLLGHQAVGSFALSSEDGTVRRCAGSVPRPDLRGFQQSGNPPVDRHQRGAFRRDHRLPDSDARGHRDARPGTAWGIRVQDGRHRRDHPGRKHGGLSAACRRPPGARPGDSVHGQPEAARTAAGRRRRGRQGTTRERAGSPACRPAGGRRRRRKAA